VTTADLVYEKLRLAIMDGLLLPSERLLEMELSNRFNAPRSAIRSAIFRLERDGLVEHERNRGAKVRVVGEAEAIEILETRALLEGLAARRAAERVTDVAATELQALKAGMREQVDSGDLAEASDVNMRIHAKIVELAAHETISRLLASLNTNLVRYQYRTILVPERPEASFAEHSAIIDAVIEGNPQAAEHEMRSHLHQVTDALRTRVGAARTGE
jgi:DNA-binding GntR family transcriptional regulator